MSGINLSGPVLELKSNDGKRVLRIGRTDMHGRIGFELDGDVLFTVPDEVKNRMARLLEAL